MLKYLLYSFFFRDEIKKMYFVPKHNTISENLPCGENSLIF